ncbi:MAG: leukotoxin LktA family filamentous adhesin [Limnohabitans sp.]|nr:MAG: leukotoxin LktA family filamentous adhesin [Limnohabitans sp.]
MNNKHSRQGSPASLARIARRRLVVRVRPLSLAAAVALGAQGPSVLGQTVITPLKGAGQTATVVSTEGNQTTVSTQSLRDGNAFSTYSSFQVGQGDVVKLAVPQGANWWVNIVRDQRVRVDGRLESRLLDGSIGGNILFVDSHGFAVGPSGQVDVGRLTFAAPSTTFVDGLLAGGGLLSGAAVDGVLAGKFERSASGAVDIQGRVNARDGVSLMAGAGAGAERAVTLAGQVVVQGRTAGSAVNLGDLKSLTPLQDRDGVIDITTPGSITLDGVLISDSSHWRHAGAVRVVAGQDIAVGASALVSASGASGSGAAGGQVTLFAQRDIANAEGATLRARGDGAGTGGAIEYSGLRQLSLSGMRFDAGSDTGAVGLVFVDPDDAVVQGINLTGGGHFVYGGGDSLTVKSGAVINTRQVASGQDATDVSVASTGNSGNIVLTAPRITVEQGAVLDASAVNSGGSTWAAGDVRLIAKASSNGSSLVGLADADASIDVAGTLKGRDIDLHAGIASEAVYAGVDAVLTQGAIGFALRALGSPINFNLSYTEATGDASIHLASTADLRATDDISLRATAERAAGAVLQSVTSSGSNLGAGFARIQGNAKVDIDAGAKLTAADNIEVVAATKTDITMNSGAMSFSGPLGVASPLPSVVFAGSLSNVTTAVNVGDGAVLTSGGDTVVQAFHSGQYQTKAQVTVYGDGPAGVVGALSLQESSTKVSMAGDVDAGGHVKVMAMNASAINQTTASSENAQVADLLGLLTLPATLQPTSDVEKSQLASSFMTLAGTVGALSAVSSGGTATSASPGVRMAGALTWAESTHSTRAEIATGAKVVAKGDAVVDAQALVGRLQTSGLSEAVSELEGGGTSPVALSVAFNYADHNFNTRAYVGDGAAVTSNHLAVHAANDMPLFYGVSLPTKWDSFDNIYKNLVGGTSLVLDGINTRVGSTATATGLALSGAVNLSFQRNDASAWVGKNATLETRVADGAPWTYEVREVGFDSDVIKVSSSSYVLDKDLEGVLPSFTQKSRIVLDASGQPTDYKVDEIRFSHTQSSSTLVRAENNTKSLHLAGGQTSDTSNGGVAVGGTFSMVDRSNTTVAGIADGVSLTTHRLDVQAHTDEMVLSMTPSAGSGEGITANGMVSYNKLTENTRASISREATVKADSVNVQADLTTWVFGVTGAVTATENSGVGIGVAVNKVDGETKAFIGDNDTELGAVDSTEGDAGSVQTSALNVKATTEGMVGAVGVAGMVAQSSPASVAPDSPDAPPNTSSSMASKTAQDSSSVQQNVDGEGTSTAAAGTAASGLQSQGGGDASAADAAPEADQPPPFSIAAAGAIVTNFSNMDTTALLDRAVVTGLNGGTTRVGVQALSDLTQVSAAGGMALAMANNPVSTLSAAIAGAVAIQRSDDDTTARIVDSSVTTLADESDALKVQALKSGERTAVATGMSLNLSAASLVDYSVVGSVSATENSDDTAARVERSTVTGQVAAPSALEGEVVAYDRSRIGAGAGALSMSVGKGSAGIGAAITLVDHKGSTKAVVEGGAITQLKHLSVAALSSQKVVGVGAVGGVQTSVLSLGQLMGAFVFNKLSNTVEAGITGGAAVNVKGDVLVQAGGAPSDSMLDTQMGDVRTSYVTDYDMQSSSNGYTTELKNTVTGESVVGVAGTLSASVGASAASVGLSYVQNNIQTTYDAKLSADLTASGGVQVKALSDADVVGISAGAGASMGKFSGMGSASVNLMGQRTQAAVDGYQVRAGGLNVGALSRGNQFSLAGNVSLALGPTGVAAGAAVSYTQSGERAFIEDGATTPSLTSRASGNSAEVRNTTIDVGSGTVAVQAVNTSNTQSLAASGAFSTGAAAVSGTGSFNEMGDRTSALIDKSLVTAGQVAVRAGEAEAGRTASIQSMAGGLAASTKGYSGAVAVGANTIETVRSAQITGSNLIVGNSVTVEAKADGAIQSLSAAAAGSMSYAAAGSISVNTLNADISAVYDGGGNSLRGTASSLKVLASGSGKIDSFAGTVAGSAVAAIGGASASNRMGEGADSFGVRATLKNIQLIAPASVEVDASLTSAIGSVAASGGGSGTAAINGSVTTNSIEAEVRAQMDQAHQEANDGTVKVNAVNNAKISSLAGSVSVGVEAAVGVAIATNSIGGDVSSTMTDSTLAGSGAVVVDATSSGTSKAAAAGMAGGGSVGVSASNTTNAITSTVMAQMTRVVQTAPSASVRVQALDSSTIQSFAGSVGASATAGGGAAFALNFLGRTALDADSSKVVKAEVINSSLRSSGAVQVKGLSTSVIESIALGVSGSGATAGSGSSTTNLLEDEVKASWSGGSLNGSTTSLLVQADDMASVSSLAGNVSVGGTAAFGVAIAVNQVGSVVTANLSDMTLASTDTAVTVDADLRGKIESVAASGGAGGTGAATGSFTTNELNASVKAQALSVTQSANGGAFAVSADNDADILSVAGTVSGGGTAAAGVAVSVNEIGGDVTAQMADSTLRATGAVTVDATSSGLVKSVAAGVAAGGTAAMAGSNTTNAITSTVLAKMSAVTQAAASSSLRVKALDSSTIQSFAGTVTGGGTASAGAAFALNFLGRTGDNADSNKVVKAEVLNSSLNTSGTVQIKGLSTSTIESMAVAVGAGGTAAASGSNTTNLLEDEITATWTGGSLRGSATSATLQADDAAIVRTLAGNVTGAGAAALGGAIAVNKVGSLVHATASGVALHTAGVAITVDADLRGEIKSVAAAGVAAGQGASAGSYTTNEVKASVKAQALGQVHNADSGAFTVSAGNDADIFSLAGTIAGSGAASDGVAVSVNDIGGDVTARIADTTMRASGPVAVTAETTGTIQSVAAGMVGGATTGAAGSNTTNGITSTVLAQMSSVVHWGESPTVTVLARDTSTIESFAGTVTGGGAASGGAAFALNFLGRTATDEDRSKVVKAEVVNTVLRSTGQMLVEAYSQSTIRSLSTAAGASANVAVNGSNTTNLLEDEITATWESGGSPTRDANVVKVSARNEATIDSLAGNLSGSVGVSAGMALAVNRIGTQTLANIKGNASMYARDTHVAASSDAQINTVAVGMSAGLAGAQGSVAVSVIDSDTQALLGDVSTNLVNVAARGSIAVIANSRDRIKALAGSLSLGGIGIGLGGGIVTNVITSNTVAGIWGSNTHVTARGQGDGFTVNEADLASSPDLSKTNELSDLVLEGATFKTRTHKGITVQATSIQQIGALTSVASGGAAGAAGASINVDHISGSTRAYVQDMPFMNDDPNSVSTAAENVEVMAANHAMVASSASALAIGSTGMSGAMGTEIIDRSTKAEVINSTLRAANDVSVKAVSTNAVAQISAGAAGGEFYGVAGSGDVVLLKGSTQALIDSARVFANNLSVVANGSNMSNLVAGSVSRGGTVIGSGVGLSFTVNVSGSTVRALVNDSDVRADGAVVVDADNRTTSLSASASAASGGSSGVAVGASVSVMEGATEAAVTGSSSVGKRTTATGLLASANDAPVTINLASDYDTVGSANQTQVRFSLNGLAGRVSAADAVVTVTDGVNTVSAVRQADGSYSANVASLDDGVLMAQVVLKEDGVQKVSTTTLLKSTNKADADAPLVAANLPAAQTRIATLSSFEQVDARNHGAVRFVLKGEAGLTADAEAVVIVSDGTRQVSATRNIDGSYTADVRSLGDGVLTALVTTPADGTATARITLVKSSGAASLSVTANETIELNHNAGQVGAGGVTGVGASANVVVGKSKVDATLDASSIRVSGAATVSAERDADIDMITATGGGGGLYGVSGAVGVLVFGAAPDSNANSELTGPGSTLGMVSGATQANRAQGTGGALSEDETAGLNTQAKYDTQGAYAGASGKHRTSATVGAQSLVAGSLNVKSLDRTVADNRAGAVSLGGAAGVSAGVAVTQLGGANHAGVSVGSMAIAGDVNVASGTRSSREGAAVQNLAVAGAGGFVGVGAAVSVASNSTANTAVLAGNLQAGGSVGVLALDESSMSSQAYGASAGALAVGVVTATATQSGSVGTSLSGSLSGQGFSAVAERNASVDAFAKGGSAGVAAGSGAGASATDSGAVSLNLASATVLDAGTGVLSLAARANPSAQTEALGVAVAAGAAVGVSVAESNVFTTVDVNADGPVSLRGAGVGVAAVLGAGASTVSSKATAGAGAILLGATGASASATNSGRARVNMGSGVVLGATGDVNFSATDAMAVSASALGVGVGYVGVGVADAKAVSNSTVAAAAVDVQGSVGGSLQVSASGNESIGSDAVAGSGGVVAGAGAKTSVDHDQSVNADLGVVAGQTLVVGGRTTIDATRRVRYDAQTTTANAAALGAAGAVTRATLDGDARARLLDGSSLDAASLRVLATNDLARTQLDAQSAVGGGGGVATGAGADVFTQLQGNATASIGSNAKLLLEDLLEVRAYNEMHGSSRAQMDLGGAVPIALVTTKIVGVANADAVIGSHTDINVYGESAVNALSYLNLEANSVSKTYGLAAAAQGNAYATATVNNRVTVGAGSELRSTEDVTLLAGQDLDFNRNKHFVTARVDLFNHSAIPVSINPEADAKLELTNALVVNADAIRSGGTIKLGGVEGSYVVEGKGKVSDWTRDLGELVGLSSEYGSSNKKLSSTAVLNGEFEAGFGNKQRLVVGVDGTVLESEGDVRYTITNEDLSASASAYVERLYDQLARYGDVPEVRAFVEAELSFYFATLLKEGLAEEMTMDDGSKVIVASSGVAANFLNIKNLRAGSGNIELFGNDVSGKASLTARADSEIYIDNQSPLNLRVYDMVVDSNGGFAKYNGTYLMSSADIGALNKTTKTTGLSVDSIDTRGGGSVQQLPKLTVKNTFVPGSTSFSDEKRMTAPDGTWADLREDQVRAPELRVNGWLSNKLGTVSLANTAGSISVYAEDPAYVPRLDGKEIEVSAGKNFVLSSPTISQSVGGSPESLYAVAYSDDQQRTQGNLGITTCGSVRPGGGTVTYNADCLSKGVNGAGGVYASGAIFIGARYLNINGTVQSGQADYNVVLSNDALGTQITNWRSTWLANRGTYLAQGKSSLLQLSGPLPTDSEAEINKRYANGTIKAADRVTALEDMAKRRQQPIIYYDAEANVLKVAPTNVQGGLVELVGSIINTGGGVVRALDGYARINIDNQTAYGLDLQGLDTGGDAGVIRITDLSKPIKNADGSIRAYAVTTYQRDTDGVFKAKVTEGTGVGAKLISSSGSLIANPSGSLKASFNYSPLDNSTYSWSAGYEFMTEKRYYLSTSSWFGFIPGSTTKWNSVDTYVKTANALVEDVYVGTNVPVGGGKFSITTNRVTTDAEREIYYRSWRKCGFLCIKKTYYVDRRTELGQKDIFTQRVAADNDIKIELVGYDTGGLTVKSLGSIRLGGNITNASGTVSLQSVNGDISQLNSGAVVEGVNLSFLAKTGIGTEASPINVVTGSGSFTADSQSGPIAFRSNSGALRINTVSTSGDVWLDGDDSIVGLTPGALHVKGNRIYLSAPRGSIGEFNADGSVKSTLNIDSGDSTNGGLSAYARNGVALKETTGNLWVNQVATGGDVYLQAPGDLIDNNRNETRDERTEGELLSLWDQAALQGTSAEASRQLTLTTTRAQYRRYWSLRDVRNVETDEKGNVISYEANPIGAGYRYRFDDELRQQYLDNGVSESQIAAMEAAQTAEVLALHAEYGTTVFQTGNDQVIAAVNEANRARGKAEVGALAVWSDAELKSPLPKAVFSKSSTDTQTRIEEPNVVGNRVVLRPGGKIGHDDGKVVIPLLSKDRTDLGMEPELTADERLAIMSAESDDMSLDKTTWTLTVVKKDTFNVLSNRLNVDSKGFVYLGADTTASYPNGGSANLEMVKGTGEIRIKVSDSILSVAAAGVSVIQGQKAILEAAQGSIGSAAKPVQMTLANNSLGTLTARAQEGIWIHAVGDLRAADVFTPGSANLSASGAIIDARPVVNLPNDGDRAVRSIEAQSITLNALGGAVGSSSNPMVLKVGADGVNANSALGYSIDLQPAEGADLVLRSVNAGLDVNILSPYGNLTNLSAVSARRSIFAEVEGSITGLMYSAGTDMVLSAGGDITGSKASAGSGSASLISGGSVTLTSLTSNRDAVISADGAISLTSGAAGRDLKLTSKAEGIQGVAWRAGNSLLATALGTQGDLSATTVTASAGLIRLISSGDLSVSLATAQGILDMRADGDMNLLNATSNGAGLSLTAGGALSMLAGRAKSDVTLQAGTGLSASSLTSAAAKVSATTTAGQLGVQTVTAAQGATLTATGGALDVGTVKTTAGTLAFTAGDALSVVSAMAPGAILVRAGDDADLRTVSSSASSVDLESAAGALKVGSATAKTTLKANAVQGELTVGSFTAASADLDAGAAMSVTGTGKTTGSMTLDSGGSMLLGTLASTGSTVTAISLQAMTAKTLQASGALGLKARTGITAGALTSSQSSVQVNSDAGSVTVASATGKTSFVASSGGGLSVGSFTVGAGLASLTASGATTLSKGTASGAIVVNSVGNAALGTLTSSGSTIRAVSSGGGLTFGTLQASTGITLEAARAWSLGNAISGTALTVTRGTADVLARSGNMTVGTLSVGALATTPKSRLRTLAGSIKVGKVLGLKASQLEVQVSGGTKSMPQGY